MCARQRALAWTPELAVATGFQVERPAFRADSRGKASGQIRTRRPESLIRRTRTTGGASTIDESVAFPDAFLTASRTDHFGEFAWVTDELVLFRDEDAARQASRPPIGVCLADFGLFSEWRSGLRRGTAHRRARTETASAIRRTAKARRISGPVLAGRARLGIPEACRGSSFFGRRERWARDTAAPCNDNRVSQFADRNSPLPARWSICSPCGHVGVLSGRLGGLSRGQTQHRYLQIPP